MQQVDRVEYHGELHGPGQRHSPATASVILRAFPHGTLQREGDEQAKSL